MIKDYCITDETIITDRGLGQLRQIEENNAAEMTSGLGTTVITASVFALLVWAIFLRK